MILRSPDPYTDAKGRARLTKVHTGHVRRILGAVRRILGAVVRRILGAVRRILGAVRRRFLGFRVNSNYGSGFLFLVQRSVQ